MNSVPTSRDSQDFLESVNSLAFLRNPEISWDVAGFHWIPEVLQVLVESYTFGRDSKVHGIPSGSLQFLGFYAFLGIPSESVEFLNSYGIH